MTPGTCIGRFAPSPSGPLHQGSLIAALASCLDARARKGQWLVRMEDVDAPRTHPGAADTILRQLEACGFEWDGPVLWQSQRLDAYRCALDQLIQHKYAYPCACSRREIADSALRAPDGSLRYPGNCRTGLPAGRAARAWRCLSDASDLHWSDAIQGEQHERLAESVGDFVLLRADGQFAYQLAVVVDDAWQGVTHVVRGADLLDSTGRQIHLQRLLGHPQPAYAHLPVLTNRAGEKLSKQTLAPALQPAHAAPALRTALSLLGQNPPVDLGRASVAEVWAWASEHWQLARVPRVRAQEDPSSPNDA
ncbi:tRNA glutamyl-Q(34) synthetase GluQRS [Uliginosibacterium sp. TH139]|uniref:tRNA glutamyl-Q(34) synthetase GluQRS n=1 Tax=Uliginosibacterium sp. TH139 TaxID=2067453 RepID=UPI000C7BF4E8|nr:tRNA glutamyl-Q(34) synthetase GluQRS [Uliginosibacterium sp. TH139]PLK47955.1 tRNA glutamyl-Q(34) synthetase GluQRS [Uliginosibacterium sp. TH139]